MTMPPGRIIMVRLKSQLSVDEAERIMGQFASPDQYHVEEVGEGYLITTRNEQAASLMMAYLRQVGVESRSLPLKRLIGIDTTGNAELDTAIRESIVQVYGMLG